MRLLVTGDRYWPEAQRAYLYDALDQFHTAHAIDIIIEGEAAGVDTMAREWAVLRGIPFQPFPADWGRFTRGAGPIRNRQMLREGYPDYVLAFHENPSASRGTKDMVEVARRAGVPYTWLPSGDTQMTLGDVMPEEKTTTGTPGPLTPDRTAVPNPNAATTRDGRGPHTDTNTVAGLEDPDAEAKAPGRTTHGATNNP